jgi:hypothetical protein
VTCVTVSEFVRTVAAIDGWDSGARAPLRHGAIRTSSELMNQRKSDVEWIDTSFA